MSTRAFIVSIFLLSFLLLFRFLTFQKPLYQEGRAVVLEKTLFSQPKISGKTQQFWLDGILIIVSRFPEYHYGDAIRISGTLDKRMLKNERQILMLYFPKAELVKKEQNPFLAVTTFIRQTVTSSIQSVLPPTETSLLLGIVFGIKENMPREFFDNLRKTGTLHVVAASGMNVSMAGGFFFGLFSFILRRQLALLFALFGLFLYTVIVGFEPSIVRASLMGGIAFSAQLIGRQHFPLWALFMSGFLMLFIDPQLIFDIGFQLSFLATLGLIILKPMIDSKVQFNKLVILREGFTTTLSAQIATLPILIANFGSFFLLSLLANTLVLWTVPIIMAIGGMAALISLIVKPLAALFLLATLPFLTIFEMVVNLFGRLPGSIEVLEFPVTLGVGYYLVLLCLVMVLKESKKLKD